ncbi:hybrid sensor histidine kinase/response regulator transcription factor [Bacteroides sp. 51]|uniref:hybrid sensor histidine kinase/response regulator transcription factor n=1 Tax=Bacteroides sp. 51 TaxID=2302938 RepID=UPI0013D7DA11|nr:hybrid sensor histidine kinase/response regulator transcription factor [Bacteroides sp. 51]NDV81203.1 hybrid sensor histidine kinase/response regulator [Bacteroides sp. 51]
MIHKQLIISGWIIILLSAFSVIQAKESYRFRTFSPEGGFYYNGVSSIVQDKDGLIWFIIDNDLYRFNGYEYKNYHTAFSAEVHMGSGKTRQFNGIQADGKGNVFAATANGLYIYDRWVETFHKIMNQSVSELYTDSYDNLWMAKEGKLTIRFPDGTLHTPLYEGKSLLRSTSYTGDERSLFVSTVKDIYRYSYESDEFLHFYSFDEGANIQSITRDRNKLWVLIADRGLFRIDIPTATIEQVYDFFHQENGGNVLTKTICMDKNGSVWIATQKGLYILNPETGLYSHYIHSKFDPFSLPNNSVWSITKDRQENMWIGTYSGGLCYVNPDESVWLKSYTPLVSALNHNLISGFTEDDTYLWIATEGGGINRMNKLTGEFTYLRQGDSPNSLAYDNTKSVVYDSQQRLWIAMFRGGLDCYDTRSKQFRHFRHDPENENSLLTNDLRKIILEGENGLWITYQLNKVVVSYYSFSEQKFTHYMLSDREEFIYDFCRGNNQLWLVSEKLYMIHTVTKEVESFSPDNQYLNSQAICTDGNGDLWIGTIGGGLIKFNTRTKEFTTYDDILRFNIYSIFSLCADDENNLWLGTDNGLLRYEISTGQCLRFDKEDGTQGQVFYPLSTFKARTGELYFGGTNGFTALNPKLLSRNEREPNLIMLDFLIDHAPATPTPSDAKNDTTWFPKCIVLKHNQSTFGFTFTSDNYLNPSKNSFRYRLRGYDDRWTETGATGRSASYTKVPSGDYTFEVMVANSNGMWNTNPYTVEIKRLPAPWLSLPAYMVYMLILGTIVFFILRHYHIRKRMKLQLYLDAVDKQKKEEIHQSQLRFFTNISHDFRTPLFLIIAVLEKLQESGWKAEYHRILDNNAQRLLNLVNDLMDFRTIENGKMALQVAPLDANHLVGAIAYDFRNYALQKEVTFEVKCDDLPASVYADRHVLEKILLNLLNNAFKYTTKGGHISIETYNDAKGFHSSHINHFTVQGDTIPEDAFLIVVRDTGIGISKESIASVFERFYKVNSDKADSHLGTGIGLALVKSLVLLHKGVLTIYSERESGTDMVVALSKASHFYTQEDMDMNKEVAVDMGELDESSEKLLSEKKHILLVEDNDDLRGLIAESLSADFEVIEAANGVIATDVLRKSPVELIISDIMMPEKDGITLCREVKGDINLSHIPFILLTAKTGLESKLEGVDSGADLYFEKPVDSRLLRASVQNIFTTRKKLQEYYAKNYFADTTELGGSRQDREFLKRFIAIVEKNIDQSEMDVNYIASELSISRAKLYNKVKSLTSKSTVEFILNYRLRKAARLLVEEDLSIREIMERVGIESQSYFTAAFKKEFDETPTAFAKKYRKKEG